MRIEPIALTIWHSIHDITSIHYSDYGNYSEICIEMNLILRLWAVLFPSVILRANLSGLKKPLSVILLMHGGAENISECH